MKQHEKDAKIAALMKQIEELEAMPVEPDQPLCVMPGRMAKGEKYHSISVDGAQMPCIDVRHPCDDMRFDRGNYFSSERQASADAHAVSVMRLMRRQPGVVGADAVGLKWRPAVDDGFVAVHGVAGYATCSHCMFPCYATEAQARAAIEAVGGEDALRRCAEYWSGVMK